MRPIRWWIHAAFAACLLARAATAGEFEEKQFHLVPFAGGTFFDDDRHYLTGEELPDAGYFGGRANVRISCLFLVEVAGGFSEATTCCDWNDWGHVSANLAWSPANGNRVTPFVSLGGGWSRTKQSAGDALDLGTIEGAAGLNVKFSNVLGARLEVRDVYQSAPDWHDSRARRRPQHRAGRQRRLRLVGDLRGTAAAPPPPPAIHAARRRPPPAHVHAAAAAAGAARQGRAQHARHPVRERQRAHRGLLARGARGTVHDLQAASPSCRSRSAATPTPRATRVRTRS
jgi:hypothetical protein